MDHNQLRDYIRSFRLDDCDRGNQGYNRVLLQLFGFTGHGKSAFINSCKYVLEGNYEAIAEAGEKDGGLTMERRSYRLTDTITIVDNRGYKYMEAFEALGVNAQLGNFLPLNQKVEWKEDYDSFMEMLENADLDPNFTDFIVPIFVYSIKKSIPQKEENEIRNFMKTCQDMTGVAPIVVLTYKTSGKYYEFEQRFRSFGAEGVFSVENYTGLNHMATRGKHTDILRILEHAIQDVKFRMEQERNPTQERIKRRIMLLRIANRYDHENKCRKEEEERIKERDRNKPKDKDHNKRDRGWCSMS